MYHFDRNFYVSDMANVEDICDEIRYISDNDVSASWYEMEDGDIHIIIIGTTYRDEYTNDHTVDLINEQIAKLKEYQIYIKPDQNISEALTESFKRNKEGYEYLN